MDYTQELIQLMKNSLPSAGAAGSLQKTVTTSTGLTAYDLQAPSKHLVPFITPLRNSMPRKSRAGNAGTASNWKVLTAYTGSGFNAFGGVPEGQRSGRAQMTVSTALAAYVTLGEEDAVTFEGQHASQGFEDANATASTLVLEKLMEKEEREILGGNSSLVLATPTAPTLTAANTGGTIANGTYDVIVVALTLQGKLNSSVANGVATTKTVTGADGLTYTVNGGSSAPSAASSTVTITGGNVGLITASTPVVNGAVAYAWFVGTSPNEKLVAITTLNSLVITALNGAGQLASTITGDHSTNVLGFDGLLTVGFKYAAAGQAYLKVMPTGTAGTGTTLTASGRGSVVEVDDMLQAMWDQFKISPTVFYVNSQELKNMTTKCMSTGTGTLLHINKGANDKGGIQLTASGMIKWYFNPFSMNPDGEMIPVKLHPDVPAGTILAYSESLPSWYKSNAVQNVAEVLTRQDYYRIDWPLRTRQNEFGVYTEEVMAFYAPFAIGLMTNIANG